MRRFYFLLILGTSLLNSCIVINSGNVSSGPLLNVSDQYIDIATGESKSKSFFWVAGTYSDKLVLEAKTNLFKNRPLKSNEYFANYTCDVSKTVFLLVFYTTRVTVSAEVLRVIEPGKVQSTSGDLKVNDPRFNNTAGLYNLKTSFKNRVDSFFIGDKIYYRSPILPDFHAYEIISVYGQDVCLKPLYGTGSSITIAQQDVRYSTKKPLDGFQVGDLVEANSLSANGKGEVVATSYNKILIRIPTQQGYFQMKSSQLKKLK